MSFRTCKRPYNTRWFTCSSTTKRSTVTLRLFLWTQRTASSKLNSTMLKKLENSTMNTISEKRSCWDPSIFISVFNWMRMKWKSISLKDWLKRTKELFSMPPERLVSASYIPTIKELLPWENLNQRESWVSSESKNLLKNNSSNSNKILRLSTSRSLHMSLIRVLDAALTFQTSSPVTWRRKTMKSWRKLKLKSETWSRVLLRTKLPSASMSREKTRKLTLLPYLSLLKTSKPWTTSNYLEKLSWTRVKPRLFCSSTTMKTTPISHSILQVWKRKTLIKLKSNSKTNYCKLLKKSTKTFFKLMFIQLSSTILMLEEFIFDQNKLVKTSSLITSLKEKNCANSSEILIESVSTSMSTLKHWRELNKLKEEPLKSPEVSKTLKKVWKNQRRATQPSTKCHCQLVVLECQECHSVVQLWAQSESEWCHQHHFSVKERVFFHQTWSQWEVFLFHQWEVWWTSQLKWVRPIQRLNSSLPLETRINSWKCKLTLPRDLSFHHLNTLLNNVVFQRMKLQSLVKRFLNKSFQKFSSAWKVQKKSKKEQENE